MAKPMDRVSADGFGQPARQVRVDIGDHGVLSRVVERRGQGVVGGGVGRPERSDSLVVLGHEVEDVGVFGFQPRDSGCGESTEQVAALLGGPLVVPASPCGGSGFGVIEMRTCPPTTSRWKRLPSKGE